MEMPYEYKALLYYFPNNSINYNTPISNKRRLKIWTLKDTSLVSAIEVVFDNPDFKLNPGDIKDVGIKILNKEFLITAINKGYKVFFGEINDIRLGEIISLVPNE
jgi:hypothetical protein